MKHTLTRDITESVIAMLDEKHIDMVDAATNDNGDEDTARTEIEIAKMLEGMNIPRAIIDLIIDNADLDMIANHYAEDYDAYTAANYADHRREG